MLQIGKSIAQFCDSAQNLMIMHVPVYAANNDPFAICCNSPHGKKVHFIVCGRKCISLDIYLILVHCYVKHKSHCGTCMRTLTFIVSGEFTCMYVRALLISGTPTTVTGESIFVPFLLQIMAESKWYHGDREAICYSETFGVEKMAAKKIKCIATDCLKNKARKLNICKYLQS